jgi:RNA polymerase sigma factor (sigma-70 family)
VIELSQSEAEPRGGFTDEVIGALCDLPPAEKEVIDLRFLHGLDVDTIAARLGISEWMVRRRLQIAVARLRLDSLDR